MREPRAEDDQFVSTINLFTRLSTSPKIVDSFVKEAEAGEKADSWFYAGLASWSLMDATAHALRKHGLLMAALDHLSAALQVDPEHWPARFMRTTYITMMHSEEADEMVAFLLPAAYGIASAREDARFLIDLQERNRLREPYCLAPYCLAATQAMAAGEETTAWQTLRSGLSNTQDGPASALGSKLAIPLVMALRHPQLKAHPDLRDELARRCRLLTKVSGPIE